MARTGGDKTKKKILETAEKLFAKHGFDATSVDLVAQTAGVNKALIYYYFKNKNDLVLCLFMKIIDEVTEHISKEPGSKEPGSKEPGSKKPGSKEPGSKELGSKESGLKHADAEIALRNEVESELEFLAGKKRILSVMFSEALRSNQRDDFLFRCAEIVIPKEHGKTQLTQSQMVREFFTGFIPMIAFAALKDKWCAYFGHPKDQVTKDFMDAFVESHLRADSKN
jgi:AcrR family transcriptional regulator